MLKACSNVTMLAHYWERKSDASLLASDITPRSLGRKQEMPVVTVKMLAALPPASRPSEPYKFTVTADFADEVTSTASVTLKVNHVRNIFYHFS